MEPLEKVFIWTAKCHRLPTHPCSSQDILTALRSTCGEDTITGMILNKRSVEISVSSHEAFDLLITRPATLPNTTFQLIFEPCYTDQFPITFYNVPLNSTGARESEIIAAAGANVIKHTIRQLQTAAGSINTGERTFLCSGRSTFRYLPLVVESYEGRQLGVRYRGQQKGIMLYHRQDRPSSSALAKSSNWADPPVTTFDEQIHQQEEEEMPLNAADQEAGGGAKLPLAQPPPTQTPTAPTTPERRRTKSVSQSDTEGRSRSPHDDRRPPCAHKCPFCAVSWPSAPSYLNHIKVVHGDENKILSDSWMGLKKSDPDAYAKLRLTVTCDVCLGVYPHPLPDS